MELVNFVDLIDGVSLSETVDDATGIASKSVLDWRSQSKNTDLKPRITLRDEKGNVIKKADDNEARYYLVPDSILSVKDGQKISAGDVIARLPKETSKTKDITGGLPRVAELFEARKAKDSAIIAENDGKVLIWKRSKRKTKSIYCVRKWRKFKLFNTKRENILTLMKVKKLKKVNIY